MLVVRRNVVDHQMGGVGARPQGILRRNFQLRYCARESLTWARLLKRVFDIDIEHCPNCGGSLKSIAVIEDPPVIVKILAHLGLPTRAPPRSPAQRFDLFQTI